MALQATWSLYDSCASMQLPEAAKDGNVLHAAHCEKARGTCVSIEPIFS